MKLKVSKESKTGLNTEFVNIESGRKIKLEQAIQQVGKGNLNYQNYVAVKNPNGTTYLRFRSESIRVTTKLTSSFFPGRRLS